MRQTNEELDYAARQSRFYQQQRELAAARVNDQLADKLGKTANGTSYINPQVVASLGLSDVDVDMGAVKKLAQQKQRRENTVINDRSYVVNNKKPVKETEQTDQKSLPDLLMLDPSDYNLMYKNPPDWWEKVDPGAQWRRLPIPDKVTNAKELLDLNEAQMVKLYLRMGYDNFVRIPGILNQKGLRRYDTVDEEGNPVYGKGVNKGPGERDLIAQKFPQFYKIWSGEMDARFNKKGSLLGGLLEDVMPSIKMVGSVVQAPFQLASILTPDFVKDIPITPQIEFDDQDTMGFTVEDLGSALRGATKGATAGFMGAAQFLKSNFEQAILNPGPGGSLFLTPARLTWDEYKAGVIDGNILYQIGKAALDPEAKVDLGGGFFPEGETAAAAREAHDAALPKINGRTWTLGNAVIQPLVKEGIIDADGYAAQALSGIVDGIFTVGTDIGVWFDPVASLVKALNLTPEAATAVINGRVADKVRDAWAAERAAAGLATKIDNVIDLPYWAARGPNDEIPKFAGVLPAASKLPDDVEQYIDDVVKETVAGKELATLDSPPPALVEPSKNTPDYWRWRFGIKMNNDGSMTISDPTRIDAMPYTRDGVQALEKLASFDNAGELYDFFLGKVPIGVAQAVQDVVDAARQLGKDVDLNEIHRVLKDGVMSGDPMYNMREVPGLAKRIYSQTGKVVAYNVSAKSRQMATMPGSTYFSFDDPISSINDMNRLMILMKVDPVERRKMLAEAIRAVTKEGRGARFELANKWMKTMLGPALRKAGVPEDEIRQLTQWANWSDEIHQWTMDAIGKGYPLPWIEDGSGEVLRSIDFINSGFLMVHPDKLQDIVRQTSEMYKIINKVREVPGVELAIGGQQWVKNRLENLQSNWLKPLALGAPLPIRMITKVGIEEGFRVGAQGNFGPSSLKALGAAGHVNYTTYGVEIKTAKEMQKVVADVEAIERLELKLLQADEALDGEAAAKWRYRLDKLEAKVGKKEDLLKLIDVYQERIDTVLPGSNQRMAQTIEGLTAAERQDPRWLRYERQKSMLHAYKDTDPDKWVAGTARDIVRMSETPVYQEVAKALLAGGTQEVQKLVARFRSGDLRPIFDEYLQGLGRQNPAFPLDTDQGVSLWLATITQDIFTRTAQDRVAIGAIATKKLGAVEKIRRGTVTDPFDTSINFRNWVKENLLNNPSSPNVAPFFAREATVEAEQKERLLSYGFKWYRDFSEKYTRGPYGQFKKWERILELMPAMDPKEAAKMAAAIEKSDAADWLKEEVRDGVASAAGRITRKEAELLGAMHAFDEVGELLYNSRKKSYFGSQNAIFFGFFDAWVEQWSVWMRKMFEQPSLLEKARLAKTGLEGATIPTWAGGNPDHGILFKDEDTGQQAVAIPFSKLAYSVMGLNAEERIPLRNMTLLSGLPGVFGVGAIIVDSAVPNTGLAAKARDVFFAFGDPAAKGNVGDYLAPIWVQGLAGAAISKIQGGDQQTQAKLDLAENLRALLVTETTDTSRATTINAVLNNVAANRRGVPVTGEAREKLAKEVQDKADWMLMLKSVGRIFLPGASTTKYFVERGGEQYSTGDVYDDLRKIRTETEEAGGTYADATLKFLEKWGPGAWIYLSGNSTYVDGMQSTKEYSNWYDKNWQLIDKYPLVAGWLGPQEGDFDPSVFSSQRARGFRQPTTVQEKIDKAQNSLAWTLYNNRKTKLLEAAVKAGWTEEKAQNSDYFSQQMKLKSDELRRLYPSWNPSATSGENDRTLDNQITQIEKMVKDKKVTSQPGGAALKEYWDYRNSQVKMYTDAYPEFRNSAWRSIKPARILRQRLERKGAALAEQTPEFRSVWEEVVSREFEPSGLGE